MGMGWIYFFLALGLLVFLLSVLPALLLIGSFAAITYFAGRHFHHQCTHRYRLGETSSLLLVGWAFLALIISSLIVRSTDTVWIPLQIMFEPVPISGLWLFLPLLALLFLVPSVATLELMAWRQRWPYRRRAWQAERDHRRVSAEKRRWERQAEDLRADLTAIDDAHGAQLRQQQDLDELAIELLQHGNARVLQVMRRRRRQDLAKQSEADVAQRERQARAELDHASGQERVDPALAAIDARLERLHRRVGGPAQQRQRLQQRLERCEGHVQGLTQKAQALAQAKAKAQAQEQSLQQSRISLG